MTEAIDVHTHIFAPGWPDFAARFGGDRWPRLEGDPATGCKLYLGATFNRSLTPHAFDPARRIEDMDRTGVAVQLLSPAPPTFCYWAPPDAAAEWHRMQNDVIAEIVARHPRRFLGAGGLPLQAPDLAVKELERVVTTLRFPAVEVAATSMGVISTTGACTRCGGPRRLWAWPCSSTPRRRSSGTRASAGTT